VLKAVQLDFLSGLLQSVFDGLLILYPEDLGHLGGHGFSGGVILPVLVVGQNACSS
jgi:hypothetical protein